MCKKILGISILPALLVLPAVATETISERQYLTEDTKFDDVLISNINNGYTGGAILSKYALVIENSTISHNTSGAAAALYDNSLTAFKEESGNYSVTINNSNITYNSAGDFGAVAIFSPGSSVSNTQFAYNTATANYANLGDGAGALMLGSESQTVVYRDTFCNNTSGTIGGAIATRPINYWLDTNYSGKGTNSSEGAKVDIIYSQFYNNEAGTRGGAFFNSFYNSNNKEGYAYVKGSTFDTNSANLGGGVFIEGWTDKVGGNAKLYIEDSTFVNNSATQFGGAIYNESELIVKDSRNYRNGGGAFSRNNAQKGGAIYNVGKAEITGATFVGNTATGSGGAIENKDTNSSLTLKNAIFTNNNADWAGALLVRGTANITGGSFTGNTSNDGGGAIYLATLANKGHTLEINRTTFKNNGTLGTDVDGGGAIGSFSNLIVKNSTFNGNYLGVEDIDTVADGGGAIFMGSVSNNLIEDSIFKNNTSKTWGGAISMRDTNKGNNEEATLDLYRSSFSDNSAQFGGAIYNTFHNSEANGVSAYINGSKFNTNNADVGGAIYNAKSGIKDSVGGELFIENSTFTGNIAQKGGAIYNENDLVVKDSLFNNNKTVSSSASYSNMGSAIFNDSGNVHVIGSTFKNNLNKDGSVVFQLDGNLQIEDSSFDSNLGGIGAAIYSRDDSSLSVSNTTFTNNNADYGVIFAMGNETVNLDGITLRNNTATKGNLISVFFTGDAFALSESVIENNKSISSESAIEVLFDSALMGSHSHIIEDVQIKNNDLNSANVVLHVYGQMDITSLKIENNNLNPGNTGYALLNDGASALVNFYGNNSFVNNNGAGIHGTQFNFGNDSVTVLNDSFIIASSGILVEDGATIDLGTSHVVSNGDFVLDGNVKGILKDKNNFVSFDVANTFTGAGEIDLKLSGVGDYKIFDNKVFDHSNINILEDESKLFTYDWNTNYDTLSVSIKSASEIANENNLSETASKAVENMANSSSAELKDLVAVIQEKLVSGTATDKTEVENVTKVIHPETESVVQSVATSVQNTVGNLAVSRMSVPGAIGRSGGDKPRTLSDGVWAQGLYNNTKQNDAFDGDTYGFAIGIDSKIRKSWTIGAGYSYAHSDIDANTRDTDIDSHTMFLYGQYKPNKWYMNGVVNYTISKYKEKGETLGIGVTSDYNVLSLGTRLATGYDFNNGLTPELVLRYMQVRTKDYDNSLGIHNSLDDTHYLTSGFNLKYARSFKATKRLKLIPELRAGVKYDIVSEDASATVTMPGMDNYTISGESLAKFGSEFGAGITLKYLNVDFSLNYDIEKREDYTSQTGMIKARANF